MEVTGHLICKKDKSSFNSLDHKKLRTNQCINVVVISVTMLVSWGAGARIEL